MAEIQDGYNRRNQVQIDLAEYEAKNAQIGALKDEIQKMKDAAGPNKMGWMWLAPEYFSRWRIFPRAFITMYIYGKTVSSTYNALWDKFFWMLTFTICIHNINNH